MCKLFNWRKWRYVEQEYPDTFLGERVVKSYISYRFNDKVAEELCCYPEGSYWRRLSEEGRKILLSKVVQKGDKFVLRMKE